MPTSIESLVSSFNALYATLEKLTYLPPSAILRPPSSGWHLPTEDTIVAGKCETVLNLMRHLPYLSDADGFRWIIAPWDTTPVNYSPRSQYDGLSTSRDPLSVLSIGEPEYMPATCLPLTNGDEMGYNLVLDTEPPCVPEGPWTITLWNPSQVEELELDRMPKQTEWRVYPTMPAEDLVELWTQRYRCLEWIPVSTGGGLEVLLVEGTGESGRKVGGVGLSLFFLSFDCAFDVCMTNQLSPGF